MLIRSRVMCSTFHLHPRSIPSFTHIVSGRNDSLVDLHQVKILLSSTVITDTLVAYEDIPTTCYIEEFNSVDYVWVCASEVQSW